MTTTPPELATARERFLEMVASYRPDLHRYCSRLVGSAIDGEDVVQEALAKAFYALSLSPEAPPLKPWLLRIAHNTAIDFLRRYERRFVEPVAEIDREIADEGLGPDVIRAALSSFVGLPLLQRSAVILKDVLGCSLDEIAATSGTTVPAVKSALVRGRAALRSQPQQDVVPWRDRPETSAQERALLDRYAALFNARDWEGVQSLLADECRLDLVAKTSRQGRKQISGYFGQYAKDDVRLALGSAEGRALLGVYRNDALAYVIAIDVSGDKATLIRDFRYVPYLIDELKFEVGEV